MALSRRGKKRPLRFLRQTRCAVQRFKLEPPALASFRRLLYGESAFSRPSRTRWRVVLRVHGKHLPALEAARPKEMRGCWVLQASLVPLTGYTAFGWSQRSPNLPHARHQLETFGCFPGTCGGAPALDAQEDCNPDR